MAFKSVTTFPFQFPSAGPHSFFSVAGRVIYLNPGSRPFQILPGSKNMYPVSIVPPIPNNATDPGGAFGYGVITPSHAAGSTNQPAGDISVVECFYRAETDERSPASDPVALTGIAAGDTITITSNTTPPDYVFSIELGISHREFYVAYAQAPGVYYLWQRIPFTGVHPPILPALAIPTDTTVADGMSFDELVLNRQLESSGETGIFPAVSTGSYAFGRFLGAGMTSRVPVSSQITITAGSKIAVMTGSDDSNNFKSSDVYRAIVYLGQPAVIAGRVYMTGETLAFVKYLVNDVQAVLEFAQGVDVAAWPFSTLTLTNGSTTGSIEFGFISRSKTDLFGSSVSANEVGGGLTNGLMMWSPLNTLRDQQNYGGAGKATFVGRAAGSLVVGYERGISIMDSEFSTDMPPRSQFLSLTDELGTFNPQAVWADNDRRLYFLAQGRIWRVDGARLVDISRAAGVSTFFRKFTGGSGALGNLEDAHVSFNAERNAALIVGLTRIGDGSKYTYAVYLAFDQQPAMALCPIRLPVAVRCAAAAPRQLYGMQFNQWFLASEDNVLTFGEPLVETDTYSGASGQSISWTLKTGILLFDWKATLKRFGHVFRNSSSSFTITCTIESFETGDLTAATNTYTRTLTRKELLYDLPATQAITARAVRVTFQGTNAGVATALLRTGLFVEPIKPTALG